MQPLAVQGRVIKEWAAYGLACAVLPQLTALRVLAVAFEGESFDYRVGNEFVEWGMEVSGTLSEERTEIEARRRAKRIQLLANPHGMGGYVVIAAFSLREIILSHHQALGGSAK